MQQDPVNVNPSEVLVEEALVDPKAPVALDPKFLTLVSGGWSPGDTDLPRATW